MITHIEAIRRIENEFPQIAGELHDEINEGLLHLQISEFSHLAQSFIDSEDKPNFERVCKLFLELFYNGESDLINALNVSFLEHLNFKDGKKQRSWAYNEMPKKMRMAFDEMEEYNKQIHGNR